MCGLLTWSGYTCRVLLGVGTLRFYWREVLRNPGLTEMAFKGVIYTALPNKLMVRWSNYTAYPSMTPGEMRLHSRIMSLSMEDPGPRNSMVFVSRIMVDGVRDKDRAVDRDLCHPHTGTEGYRSVAVLGLSLNSDILNPKRLKLQQGWRTLPHWSSTLKCTEIVAMLRMRHCPNWRCAPSC